MFMTLICIRSLKNVKMESIIVEIMLLGSCPKDTAMTDLAGFIVQLNELAIKMYMYQQLVNRRVIFPFGTYKACDNLFDEH